MTNRFLYIDAFRLFHGAGTLQCAVYLTQVDCRKGTQHFSDVRTDACDFIEAYSHRGEIHDEAILRSVIGISASPRPANAACHSGDK
jgi:hypothetical protein